VNLAELVGSALAQGRSENVDRTGITVTGEGPEVEIVIVPHRDLGGVSLVAWTDERGVRLVWADVGDLSTHDGLDLGLVVERIPYEGDWQKHFRNAFAAELERPIRLRVRGGLFGARVECWIEEAGKRRRIGTIRPPRDEIRSAPDTTTYLAGGPRPPFSVRPHISHSGR
jgi:hypothetical protein